MKQILALEALEQGYRKIAFQVGEEAVDCAAEFKSSLRASGIPVKIQVNSRQNRDGSRSKGKTRDSIDFPFRNRKTGVNCFGDCERKWYGLKFSLKKLVRLFG